MANSFSHFSIPRSKKHSKYKNCISFIHCIFNLSTFEDKAKWFGDQVFQIQKGLGNLSKEMRRYHHLSLHKYLNFIYFMALKTFQNNWIIIPCKGIGYFQTIIFLIFWQSHFHHLSLFFSPNLLFFILKTFCYIKLYGIWGTLACIMWPGSHIFLSRALGDILAPVMVMRNFGDQPVAISQSLISAW